MKMKIKRLFVIFKNFEKNIIEKGLKGPSQHTQVLYAKYLYIIKKELKKYYYIRVCILMGYMFL